MFDLECMVYLAFVVNSILEVCVGVLTWYFICFILSHSSFTRLVITRTYGTKNNYERFHFHLK